MVTMKNETEIRVRYKETDQMGVAYHANYLIWFEVGRAELMRSIGLPYREFEKNGLFLPVLKVYCEYKHAVKYDEQITVVTRLQELQNVRLYFSYEIRLDNRLMAGGYTEHAFINEKGKPVALKKTSPFLWNHLCKAIEKQQEGEGDSSDR